MEIEVAAVVIKADYDQAMSGAIGEDEVVIGAREHLIYERRDERGTEVVEQGERAGCLSAITGRGGLGEALAVGAAGCLVGFLRFLVMSFPSLLYVMRRINFNYYSKT